MLFLDPAQHERLEYLRPILGHIHAGGMRFKDHIESAFKRQGLMLAECLRQFESRMNPNNTLASPDLLHALLWGCSRELHYVAHFRDPLDLDVDVGDIGYITGNPPKFTRLANISNEICDIDIPYSRVEPFRPTPADRWATEKVQGIVRCVSDVSLFEVKLNNSS
jgi:hypothetical protein